MGTLQFLSMGKSCLLRKDDMRVMCSAQVTYALYETLPSTKFLSSIECFAQRTQKFLSDRASHRTERKMRGLKSLKVKIVCAVVSYPVRD
jgi:hypothetical protein